MEVSLVELKFKCYFVIKNRSKVLEWLGLHYKYFLWNFQQIHGPFPVQHSNEPS